MHVRAVVAARQSADVSAVSCPAEFDQVVRAAVSAAAAAGPGRWVRVTGWHESGAGPLDRQRLDGLAGPVPVRVQHRSGAVWVLNSAGLALTGAGRAGPPGMERDGHGELTGRLFRLDDWLRARLGTDSSLPPLADGLREFADECAQAGITGWTDATPGREQSDAAEFSQLAAAGAFRQRLVLMTASAGLTLGPGRVTAGPVKVMLDDSSLPAPADLASVISAARNRGATVAVHCVTADQLVVAVTAFEQAGSAPDGAVPDRIEHAGIVPPGCESRLADCGLAVVTQPGFIAARGDVFRQEVEPAEQGWLYPAASLARAGVVVAASTDAPFGPADPWRCISSAVSRRSPSGEVLGPAERVSAKAALAMFLAAPEDLRRTRTVAPGQPADLCLLRTSLAEALAHPSASVARATVAGGQLTFRSN